MSCTFACFRPRSSSTSSSDTDPNMPGLFSRLVGKDSKKKKTSDLTDAGPSKPTWDDAWTRKTVEPEEIHELIHCCTEELKARALDHPFLLLPFRPTSDPSAVRTFVRHFFDQNQPVRGEALLQEIKMTEPMVISGVVKWCFSRLQGGVVGWDAYELFKVGEFDSNMARDSFKTFIPISVENGARQRIIFDFFDLMAAIAAHGKSNGLGGRKLSRMAAWWAFEQKDTGNGFEGGYNAWLSAADATSHLFFAYLRSLAPEQNLTGISMLPMSLQKLVQETEYPPQKPELMMSRTNKVVMIVDIVSPTPFALLRRANHFQYRDTDKALKEFSEYDDPVQALSEECKRVLKAVSAANQSQVSSSKHSTSLRDASWSRFEDIGFSSALVEDEEEEDSALARKKPQALKSAPTSGNGLDRPTTPSWADFLSSGFVDDDQTRPSHLLPPDKVLPPIDTQHRQRSSQSHRPRLESDRDLDPGELASITFVDLDDAFWWVWMSSLAPEETPERKSAFGRCAVIETKIRSGRWLVLEEMVAGAAPEVLEGAYIAEKKGLFSWTRRGRTLGRRKSTGKHALDKGDKANTFGASKTSIGPDTHARIQAKAAQLRAAGAQEKQSTLNAQGRGQNDSVSRSDKHNSTFTLQPAVVGEASSAMKWVNKYDKGTIKDAYLANNAAGKGLGLTVPPTPTQQTQNHASSPKSPKQPPQVPRKEASVPSATASPSQRKPVSSPVPATPTQKIQEPKSPLFNKGPEVLDVRPLVVPQDAEPSPAPPSKDGSVAGSIREKAASPELALSLDIKKDQKKPAGFRKLFSRRNRASKLPDNASGDLNNIIRKDSQTPEPTVQPPLTPAATPSPVTQQTVSADDAEKIPRTPKSGGVSNHEDAEAKQDFSRFDQGPLEDQPAFTPQDSDDDATPPPISRRPLEKSGSSMKSAHEPPKQEHLSQSAAPGVQDRWAQIRKNAAERAAHYERESSDQGRVVKSKTNENDDDTSGEETIESRVARIKARVAELTGTMEGTSVPGTPQVPQSPAPEPTSPAHN